MATKYKAPPLVRSYDRVTGKLVNSTVDLYNPQGGRDAELMAQWHLKWLGDIGTVWGEFTGKGVSVGVYDDGVQRAHCDLDDRYDASKHVVVDGKVLDGNATGPHGTSVAGLIAAERNGRGGVGVAYDATLTGVNIFDTGSPLYVNGSNTDALFIALRQANQFDVVNHSWGGGAGFITATSRSNPDSFSGKLAASFRYVAETGRDGLGTVSVQAAGNDAVVGLDKFGVTDRHVIAVGAYRQADGVAANYSDSGPHLLVSAPSSDTRLIGGTGQVTTDLLGGDGYNMSIDPGAPNDYTDQFGGTSGAAPIVSGVVTLMLDANENLGWRDVQNILAASAKMPIAYETGQVVLDVMLDGVRQTARMNESRFRLGGEDAGWNGGRMHYSNDYGYGAVDAYNAVRMAEVWGLFGAAKTSGNEMIATVEKTVGLTGQGADYELVSLGRTDLDLGDGFRGTPASFTFEVTEEMRLEHIDLTLDYFNTLDLFDNDGNFLGTGKVELWLSQIKLIAPDGTQAFIAPSGMAREVADSTSFTFGLSGFRGVESAGTWTLQFAAFDLDNAAFLYDIENSLTVNSLKMEMTGSAVTSDDVYTYTNEFFTMAAIRGESGRKVLNDTDGGTDWINAAAVSSDVKLSLAGGATSFGGQKAFLVAKDSMIENAVTGDGNDMLTGNWLDNKLFGMRGNDVLNGGLGDDTLFGGWGNDRFVFDTKGVSGKDTVLDWSRGDLIATSKALKGVGTDGNITVAANAKLLLDGVAAGDTVLLQGQAGSVLKDMGQQDGYFLYAFVSGADIDPGAVIREAGFQPAAVAAGMVAAMAAPAAALSDAGIDAGAGIATAGDIDASFYLYDAMAGSMSGGVMLAA